MSKETEKVKTGLVRFAYPDVLEARAFKGADPKDAKYGARIIIDKEDTATLSVINRGIAEAKDAAKFKGSFKSPLKDGDVEYPDDPDYVGKMFLHARSKFQPGVVDAARNPITDPAKFYSGVYGRAVLTFLPYTEGGNGVSARLKAVQKIKDGEPIKGSDGTEAFDDDFVASNTTDGDDFM